MVDYDFFDTFNMELIQGRTFSKEFPLDETEAVIINESALSAMGIDSPVGTKVYFAHPAFEESFRQVKIIGVIKDFHFRSLHEAIRPFIFRIYRPWLSYMFIKISPENVKKTLRDIETVSKPQSELRPGIRFVMNFLTKSTIDFTILKRGSGSLFVCLRLWQFLFLAWDYSDWRLIHPNRKPKRSGFAKCWAQT
jgi:hypothetical protein